MPNPTTIRRTPQDDAKLEQLRLAFPGAPDATIWRMGLDALLEKHADRLPKAKPSPKKKKPAAAKK